MRRITARRSRSSTSASSRRFQIAQMRLLLAHGFLGQTGKLVGHGRQIELTGVLLNGSLSIGWDALTESPPSLLASLQSVNLRLPVEARPSSVAVARKHPCWVAGRS